MRIVHVEGDPKLKNGKGNPYAMFIGRFQPFHDGHKWVVNQLIDQGKNVLICVRDVEPDENNPYTSLQVQENIKRVLWTLVGDQRIKVMIIPDIESVNFGRGVGYDIVEYLPPSEISEISASKIRNNH